VAVSVLSLAAAALAGAQALPAGATRLVGWVDWTASGETGRALFQGLAKGPALEGHLYAGEDRLVVHGDIGDDGSITGTVAAADGTPLGTFAGTRTDDTLEGTYSLSAPTAEASETWEADAGDMPTPTPESTP
jgi:hypothetical protein